MKDLNRELLDFIDRKGLSAQLIRLLDIASQGLKERGKNEEHFLEPLDGDLLGHPAHVTAK